MFVETWFRIILTSSLVSGDLPAQEDNRTMVPRGTSRLNPECSAHHSLLSSSALRDMWLKVPDVTDIWSWSTVATETSAGSEVGLAAALMLVTGESMERQAWRARHGASEVVSVFWKER